MSNIICNFAAKLIEERSNMKLKMALKVGAVMLACVVCSKMWAAEGTLHEFPQTIEVSLNNNASIPIITISEPSYPIKEVIVSYSYNNENYEKAVTIQVAVGSEIWGTEYSEYTGTQYQTCSFTHESEYGGVAVGFTNNTGYGSGHGKFKVNKIILVEGTDVITNITPVNADHQAHKHIENGMLVIIKNGMRYTPSGMRMK